jgi:hypothetical protein
VKFKNFNASCDEIKRKTMNGNMLIKNSAEPVTCSGFEAKKGNLVLDKETGGASIVR